MIATLINAMAAFVDKGRTRAAERTDDTAFRVCCLCLRYNGN